jgi:hypothetical protein
MFQRDGGLAQGFVVLAQPPLSFICGLGAQPRGKADLFDNLLVISLEIYVLLLLQIVHRLGQQQMHHGFMIVVQLFGGQYVVELIDGGLGPLILQKLAGDVDFLVDGRPAMRIDKQISGEAEKSKGEQKQRQLPKLRNPTSCAM